MDKEKCVDVCNSLLRGELSAIETYEQALEKFNGEPQAVALREIKADHIRSVNTLKNHIRKLGGEPSQDSGAWGTFAKLVQGSAKLFGENSALEALKQGEEYGREQYEDAIKSGDVLNDFKPIISNELLSRQSQHIQQLEGLMASN